jgi:tryptophanase
VDVTPAWESQISDDHTPVEFSISFDMGRTPRLRFLVEPSGRRPDLGANMQAGLQVLELLADRYQFSLDRLSMLQDLFFPRRPQGTFGLWLAAELGRSGTHRFKVYLNPAVHGPDRASQVVGEALARLGFGDAFLSLLRYGVPRNPQVDRFYIFSLDLGSPWGRPRVKVYIRHEGFSAAEAALTACAVPGVSPESIAQFCELVGGPGRFTGRPLISCFSLVEGDHERPSGHALHVPIRDYVEHDREARNRASAALDCYGFDASVLGRALAGVSRRPLAAGVGLISYVALVCNPRPRRMTVYLSSEAYGVAPPRSLPVLLRAGPAVGCRGVVRKQAVVRAGQRAGVAPVTIMEPYRIKVVEPIPLMTREEREVALAGAQPAAAMTGDGSHAGARSVHRFRAAVEELASDEHILLVHQGGAAERILFTTLLESGQIAPSNTRFDTTRANVEVAGGQARDIPCREAHDLDSLAPFKGDVDLEALEQILDGPARDRVAPVIVTIANGGGGQPVSMGNLAAVSRISRKRRVPMFLDAARFAGNARLVAQREPEFRDWSPREVAEAAFRLANSCVAKVKKDGLVDMGGFLALRDEETARRCELVLIATEGFAPCGGLAGRDLDMLAQGLVDVRDPDYLPARADMARHRADLARAAGVAIVEPPGIHAIYPNAWRLLPHLPAYRFPGHALAGEVYLEGGIRSAELGSFHPGEGDGEPLVAAPYELVCPAVPRRVSTQTHIEYVGRVLVRVAKSAERIPGYRIVGSPAVPRHFRAKLEPVPIPRAGSWTGI